jgi:UDP-N-acetylglucosamine diphosphorylase/glucosamine-1-phosphate N-acetyltransferase
MNYILFDDQHVRTSLLPLTFTRPVSEIRVGICTITQKWEQMLRSRISFLTEPYLQTKYPQVNTASDVFINGAICPDEALLGAIGSLQKGDRLMHGDILVAYRPEELPEMLTDIDQIPDIRVQTHQQHITIIRDLCDIYTSNGEQIRADFRRITAGRASRPITDPHTAVYNPGQVFIEEGVEMKACVLNAEGGPIYIGRNAQLHEGTVIRGPISLGEGSVLNMGSKIRPDTTIGPYCKVGGEVSNSVIFGHSNKSHDGFMGNSVLGEWCNLGADTNTSNMKNDYGHVKQWSYNEGGMRDTGRQFCGLVMGDHSKAGINTMFNTGTVVGVSCNVFGGDFPPKYVPSFSWGGASGLEVYHLGKALEVADRAMQRRGLRLDDTDRHILTTVFNLTHTHKKTVGFRAH